MIKEADRHFRREDPWQPRKLVDVIIETPKGSHAKYKFDRGRRAFILDRVLPVGVVFPYCFGFVPGTTGVDGDPLDVLVLTDVSAFPGCIMTSRLIGVLEAEQTEKDGSTVRSHRFIAVAAVDPAYIHIHSSADLPSGLSEEIVHFFISFSERRGVIFKPLGMKSADAAMVLLEKSKQQAISKHRNVA